ncbi:MAG: hypothetical protein QJQ54_02335 [Mollicutes bacterium]|nr:MAG: hypothetical protein QJQ54_02335 [Mollicutes bacterium]
MKLGLGLENTQTFLKQNKKLLSIIEENINMFFSEKNKKLAELNK